MYIIATCSKHSMYFKLFQGTLCIISFSNLYIILLTGEQMVNHIPNCQIITNKLGLLNTLRDYSKSPQSKRGPKLKLEEFVPMTYRLEDPAEKEQFEEAFKGSFIVLHICKTKYQQFRKVNILHRDILTIQTGTDL